MTFSTNSPLLQPSEISAPRDGDGGGGFRDGLNGQDALGEHTWRPRRPVFPRRDPGGGDVDVDE